MDTDLGKHLDNADALLDTALQLGMTYLPKLVLAIVTLLVGFWLIRRLHNGLSKLMSLRHVEPTLTRFMLSFTDVVLKILLVLSVAGMVGVETTSLPAWP